ncbi:sensor histidine kinase [Streptomyces brasiliensis]|uniref:histidine kinase n=1 Tax=Streptomyces brasiliensis TaxID=1954 RepID=A0A917PAG2_9ACTN|nr:ATP-binding protein [Streptomyces brasiliensis]GGJ68641.1 histidine kinase [Streptomyces brasiliensis]
MSVPAPPSQHRQRKAPRKLPTVPLVVLVASTVAAGAAAASAPAAARGWALTTALIGWLWVSVTVVVSALTLRRVRRSSVGQSTENANLEAQLAKQAAETAHLVNATLPAVAKRLHDGATVTEALANVPSPSDPQLRQVAETFCSLLEQAVQEAAALDAERHEARQERARASEELERLTAKTLPSVVAKLHDGGTADTVLAELDLPKTPLLRAPVESFVRELAHSERRAAAAQAASAKALSRVQAKAVSMLADLRDMQERHSEEVFGDLLKLDHSTSQLGLMTDRLALLMGGRTSRAWNKPIVMESILRGAVGRIAAYQRVRLHCSTNAAVSGFAAEGVMHLLAELMDNAANFSPPIDEVHVYVEERSAGLVVTIEDSGLKMADAAMRHAEQAVAGRVRDLASLQGTRLGLAVVGRLAVKYGISVNFRPSSRGGTGVVVLLPPQLLAQQRDSAPRDPARRPTAAAPTPGPAPVRESASTDRPDPATDRTAGRPEHPEQSARRRTEDSTPNGLPVRAPGHTMAEAERERLQRSGTADGTEKDRARDALADRRATARDAGSTFGAFHRGRRSGSGGTSDTPADPGPLEAE